MKLSLHVSCELKKRGLRILRKNIMKSLLFWGVSMTALFVTGSRSKLFNMREQPVWFWGVFVILLAAPVLYFKFYRLLTYPVFRGTVTELKNRRQYVSNDRCYNSRRLINMSPEDTCILIVSDGKREYKIPFTMADKATFARENYQVGDAVYHPRFAKYPFNESRLPSHPFCLCCGYIGAAGERECPDCGVPFVPDHMEESEKTEEQDT